MNHHTELIGEIAHEVYQSLGSGFSEDDALTDGHELARVLKGLLPYPFPTNSCLHKAP
jgi:hypothetical protein